MKPLDEKTVSAEIKTYRRAAYIGFYAPLGAAPYMQIVEETALLEPIEGISVNPESRTITIEYAPDMIVDIVDRNTGIPKGEAISVDELADIMYSVLLFGRTHQPPVIEPPTTNNPASVG